MKAFVIGLTGFVGPHLAKMLVGKECEVVGLGIRNEDHDAVQSLPKGVSVANITMMLAGRTQMFYTEDQCQPNEC
jgi:GDP-D-mannose dehydratase